LLDPLIELFRFAAELLAEKPREHESQPLDLRIAQLQLQAEGGTLLQH
jgi:hypothetical protein